MQVSRTFSGLSSVKFGVRAAVGALTLGAMLGAGSAAQAQTYIGEAYGLDTVVASVLGVGIADVNLPGTGSATPITSHLANASLNTTIPTIGLLSSTTTGVIDTSTVGASGFVDSNAITNGLNSPIETLALVTIGLAADTVQSETTATFSSATAQGTTTIENLHYTNALGQTVQIGAVAGYQPAANTVITDVPGVASVTLNEQIWNPAHTALTTNAIDVKTVLGSHVIVSSTTAGFAGVGLASAPEPGSFALIGSLAVPGLIGAVRVRCRARKGNVAKPAAELA